MARLLRRRPGDHEGVGFDPTTITVPFPYGSAIRTSWSAHAREWLAKSLPTARKRFFAGDGHVSLVVNHLDELSAAIKTTYA